MYVCVCHLPCGPHGRGGRGAVRGAVRGECAGVPGVAAHRLSLMLRANMARIPPLRFTLQQRKRVDADYGGREGGLGEGPAQPGHGQEGDRIDYLLSRPCV